MPERNEHLYIVYIRIADIIRIHISLGFKNIRIVPTLVYTRQEDE